MGHITNKCGNVVAMILVINFSPTCREPRESRGSDQELVKNLKPCRGPIWEPSWISTATLQDLDFLDIIQSVSIQCPTCRYYS